MAEKTFDYDFMGFTYNGVHSIRDLQVYRVSDGSRYTFDLVPAITDKTMDIPGNDGMYFFNSYHKQRQFSINIAFNHLTETNLRKLRQLFNGKTVGELIFDELPFKAYAAKITGTPTIKAICFDEETSEGSRTLERIYKGEGTIQFTCYLPYAYTPNWCWTIEEGTEDHFITMDIDGRLESGYKNNGAYPTFNEWIGAAGLRDSVLKEGHYCNYGDVPAPFTVELDNVPAGTEIVVGSNKITTVSSCSKLKWDSRTGLVLGDNVPIDYVGNSCGAIPADEIGVDFTTTGGDNATLDYKFWYY